MSGGGHRSEGAIGEFLSFFDAVSPDLYRFVSRLCGGDRALTEDVVQDTALHLARAWRDGRLESLDVAWVMVVARRRFIDHVRRASSDNARVSKVGSAANNAAPADVDVIGRDEARRLLQALPDTERHALSLHVVADLPVAEVAAVLGRSVAATTSLLARARRRLRESVALEVTEP